jgi:Fur family ferric uptake transcriptional regulator
MAKPDILSEKIIALLEKKHLLTAHEILAQLEKKGTPYNKTSVYRSLEKLLSSDTICRHEFNESEASYELHGDHHDHVVCTTCGIVESVNCKLTQSVRVPGFSIDHHHLTLFGVCKKCRTA